MTKFGMAQPVRRVEDPRLLLGQGRYTDDIAAPGALYGYVLRSPHAAAKILSIDTTAAQSAPGIIAIYTGADLEADGIGPNPCPVALKNRDGTPRASVPRPILAQGEVRHAGDPVAFIVAQTLAAARDAAELITIDYDPLPSITDLATAMDENAPQVWPEVKNNIAFDWETGDKQATDQLFATAAHITTLTIVNNRIIVASMEPRAALADYTGGRFTLTTNTQGGWFIRDTLAKSVLKTDPQNIRVITPDVGGGFGMKLFLYAEQALVCYAARKLARPVRWTSDRSEAFLSDSHGRDNLTTGELALDENGNFLALRVKLLAGMGAYLSNFAPMIPTAAGTGVLASVYNFKAIHANVIGLFTNTVPVDAYRGAGRPESNYLVERLIDQAAFELKIDRVEIRARNLVPPEAMPHTTPMGKTYDSGDFKIILTAAAEKADWQNFESRRAASAAQGKRRGIGLAYYLEATAGAGTERAEIKFSPDGLVDVYVGTQSTGQGHETAYFQVTAAQLGIDGAKIRIHQGDTDTIPTGGGTGGARSLVSEGAAILATAAGVIEKGKHLASDFLEAAATDIEFAAGKFTITGTDRAVELTTLAAQNPGKLDTAEIAKLEAGTYPNGCHIAEVEVDPETGTTKILRYLVVDDVGIAVNPLIVRGQVHGGVAQGIGQALLERTAYDSDSGQLLSASFQDYALPRADDLPNIEVDFIEIPCTTNPLAVKGAGEAGAVGSPPAVINAIVDALRPAGVQTIDMPATPERVWEAIKFAKVA